MSEFEKIAILNNEIEARLLGAILDERGIPHVLNSYYDTAYDGLFQPARGWGHVEAPRTHKEEVIAILEDLRPSADSEEDPPQ